MMASKIFSHDIMGCTAEGVVGNHLYSGRALGISAPDDIVLLHPDLRSQWDAIRAHYDRVGLDYSDNPVWDIGLDRLTDYPDHELSVFFFGPDEHRARPDPAWLQAVVDINSKNQFMRHAQRLRVPVPRTLCFDDVAAIEPQVAAEAPYPCYLKAAVSVSGVGIYRCTDAASLSQACGQFAAGTPVQIQQEVRAETFLNLQYEADGAGVRRLAATEQVLDGYVHQGNRHPARHRPWEVVDPLADWLGEAGLRGLFAFDVAVTEEAGNTAFLAIECNPRFNGASYPTLVAEKLEIRHWLALAFTTKHRRLADLNLGGLEYDPEHGQGVVLVNWGPILVGKFLALIAGTEPQQQQLIAALRARL